MGFRLNRTYVLDFAGTALDGLEVKIGATSVATSSAIRDSQSATDLCALLAENMLEWNYADATGEVVPITAEAIGANLEESVLAKICREWYKAAVGVTAPLDESSTSGEPYREASIPTGNE